MKIGFRKQRASWQMARLFVMRWEVGANHEPLGASNDAIGLSLGHVSFASFFFIRFNHIILRKTLPNKLKLFANIVWLNGSWLSGCTWPAPHHEIPRYQSASSLFWDVELWMPSIGITTAPAPQWNSTTCLWSHTNSRSTIHDAYGAKCAFKLKDISKSTATTFIHAEIALSVAVSVPPIPPSPTTTLFRLCRIFGQTQVKPVDSPPASTEPM